MEERHAGDLAEARLRDLAREGEEILAAERDTCESEPASLLAAALDGAREDCCRRAAMLLRSLPYEPALLSRVRQAAESLPIQRRSQAWAAIAPEFAEHHRALLTPLFRKTLCPVEDAGQRLRQERLIELASGRYQWATPWVRLCALHMLDPAAADATPAFEAAARDSNAIVAGAASGALQASRGGCHGVMLPQTSMIGKVLLLKAVSIFEGIPHGVLLSVATLLTGRWLAAGEVIFRKGDPGDSLYVIGEGRVSVHDGVRTIRELSQSEFFGELSLLDSEPRSASVTALDRTLVFRLAQESFYALVSEQPVIAHAINRELCRKIRNS